MFTKNASLKRRDREKIARRNDILKAAQKVFAKKGYEKATLDEIAEKAEYGKGTIYNYFKGKEDLFLSLMQDGIDKLKQIVMKAIDNEKGSREKLRNIAGESLKFSMLNGDFFRVLLKEYGRLALYMNGNFKESLLRNHLSMVQIIADVIQKGIENSEIRKIDPIKAANFFIFMIHVIVWKNKCYNIKVVTDEDVDFLLSLFFEGITIKSM